MCPTNQLNEKVLSWLLEPDSTGVRYLALRDLCDLPENDPRLIQARTAAHKDGPITEILAQMQPEGFWSEPGAGYNPKYYSTVWSLIQLAQLGANLHADERIATGCSYLLDHALTKGGQFTATGAPSGTADCLQGNLCWALTELGCTDPRLETAFEWMARTVTGDGVAPMSDRQAERRYYAGKCGPDFACGANNKLPCAWGAVKVMLALAKIPPGRRNPLIQKAIDAGVDFLFSVDPATAGYPTAFTGKPSQSWFKFGFPVFYITDILQIVGVLARLGFGKDPRLANAVSLVRSKQDCDGRWPLEYTYEGKTWAAYGAKRQPNKWVTYRALRTLREV